MERFRLIQILDFAFEECDYDKFYHYFSNISFEYLPRISQIEFKHHQQKIDLGRIIILILKKYQTHRSPQNQYYIDIYPFFETLLLIDAPEILSYFYPYFSYSISHKIEESLDLTIHRKKFFSFSVLVTKIKRVQIRTIIETLKIYDEFPHFFELIIKKTLLTDDYISYLFYSLLFSNISKKAIHRILQYDKYYYHVFISFIEKCTIYRHYIFESIKLATSVQDYIEIVFTPENIEKFRRYHPVISYEQIEIMKERIRILGKNA